MIDPAWKIGEIRQQIAVIDGKIAPSIVLTNARYLHSMYKRWVQGNIWILEDRIVYAGPKMPVNTKGTEIVNVKGQTIVPGYIEPHVHPFQLYNPQTLADYSAQLGTTTFISDNMSFFLEINNKKTFSILDQLKQLPFTFYWWVRFDSQTELLHEHDLFTTTTIHEWMERRDVLLGGELTGWPRLVAGDDQMLYWLQAAKAYCKKIE